MDPVTATGLALGAKVVVLPAVRRFVDKLAKAGDTSWQTERQELYENWLLESEQLQQERFDYLHARMADLEAKVEERGGDPAAVRVHANIAIAAEREPTPERRRMLAYADAALIDTTLTVAQHSRVERLLRELDPEDVLWLSVIDSTAGTFFEGQQKNAEDRVRWEVWNRAGADILAASGCVRVTHHTAGGGAGVAASGWDGVEVTREGRLVLRVLRLFVRATPPPTVAPGHEARPGDFTEDDAWRMIDAVQGLRAEAIRLSALAAPPRYDFPKVDYRDGKPPAHNAKGILYLRQVPQSDAAAICAVAPLQDDPMKITIGMLVDYVQLDSLQDDEDREKRVVRIHGPHDVLRWLADEVDARWT